MYAHPATFVELCRLLDPPPPPPSPPPPPCRSASLPTLAALLDWSGELDAASVELAGHAASLAHAAQPSRPPSRSAAAQSQDPRDPRGPRAGDQYREGVRLNQAGDFVGAARAFEAAHRTRPRVSTLLCLSAGRAGMERQTRTHGFRNGGVYVLVAIVETGRAPGSAARVDPPVLSADWARPVRQARRPERWRARTLAGAVACVATPSAPGGLGSGDC